jgi:hypothetical protein
MEPTTSDEMRQPEVTQFWDPIKNDKKSELLNPKNGVKASVSNESGQFRASEGKEIKGVHMDGGLR